MTFMSHHSHAYSSIIHSKMYGLSYLFGEDVRYKDNRVNSLAPGRFKFNFRYVISKLILVNGGWGISYEIALRWMPLDLTDDKSILVQVMAWCRQATSHYLSQCWPKSMLPNGITRPQWINSSHLSYITKDDQHRLFCRYGSRKSWLRTIKIWFADI